MDVHSVEDVERIVRSVIQQYGLVNVRYAGVETTAGGWTITVEQGGETVRFVVRTAPAARVREAIARKLGAV